MIDIFSAFGLSSAAGFNAYLPLLIVGLLSRFTPLVDLQAPWDTLENPWVLLVLAILLLIEMTVDKIPAVDTVNDIIQTVVRPAAGAILFAMNGNAVADVHPAFALILGLLVAGSVHAVKASARPAITVGTAGLANPVVSVIEDIISGLTTLLALLMPVLGILLLLLLLAMLWRWRRKRRQKQIASHW